MNDSVIILLSVFFPMVTGFLILLKRTYPSRRALVGVSVLCLGISSVFGIVAALWAEEGFIILNMGRNLDIYFHIDELGRMFAIFVTVIWFLACVFSVEYMKHEEEEKRFYGFYLIAYGALMALSFAGNMVTYYFFFEMMTLVSLPLVLHSRKREAIQAGIKYMLYSLCGAYMCLMAIYFLNHYATSLNFTPGGCLDKVLMVGHEGVLRAMAFLTVIGFGVKSGMFPMHGWLPTAHPVAPAPASAVLSGIIVKFGVLGVIRSIYYLFGVDFIRGTWVQTAWIVLSLITIFMGSMLAYREKMLKKRFAYSTVSQVSYILFGLALLTPQAMTGSLLHAVFHACIKSCLFLSAGAIIYKTGKTKVAQLTGIGKQMPVLLWCYTFAALALVGIPPFSGFISKWYLATGALQSGVPVVEWLGPVILLISALLTAGYLMTISVDAFLPGNDFDYTNLKKDEPAKMMLVPLLILAASVLILGVFPKPLIGYISGIVENVFLTVQ